MSILNCDIRCNCSGFAIIASLIIGIITSFFRLTGTLIETTAFLWVILGIAVVYLALTLFAAILTGTTSDFRNLCSALTLLLIGLVGTIFVAIVMLAFEFAATSVIGAIALGLLILFFFLSIISAACLVRYITKANN